MKTIKIEVEVPEGIDLNKLNVDCFIDGGYCSLNYRIVRPSEREAAVPDLDAAKRLRRVCGLLGLANAVPQDDAELWRVAFSVLGMVARQIETPREHDYYGAGQLDCPRDIIGGNGELHTLQCRNCGKKNPRSQICYTTPPQPQVQVPDKKPLPELLMASYHEAIGWNNCIDAMLAATLQSPEEKPVLTADELENIIHENNCLRAENKELKERLSAALQSASVGGVKE